MEFKILTYDDYNDILDISKNIWEGTDYLPQVFHKWVDEKKGCFLGLIENNKVVAVGKYTVFPDNQGWLEGLRVHIDYRGKKYARAISDKLFNMAKEDLENNEITKIGMCTHKDTLASIKMMQEKNFRIEKKCILLFKNFDSIKNKTIELNDFKVESWNISYDEFKDLNYFKSNGNLLSTGFVFMDMCKEVYDDLVENNCLVKINNYKGIIKLKASPTFICIDENIDSINTFANYLLCKYPNKEVEVTINNDSDKLIQQLKNNDFESISNFEKDLFYFIYKK